MLLFLPFFSVVMLFLRLSVDVFTTSNSNLLSAIVECDINITIIHSNLLLRIVEIMRGTLQR